jgi:hypothetical protein
MQTMHCIALHDFWSPQLSLAKASFLIYMMQMQCGEIGSSSNTVVQNSKFGCPSFLSLLDAAVQLPSFFFLNHWLLKYITSCISE